MKQIYLQEYKTNKKITFTTIYISNIFIFNYLFLFAFVFSIIIGRPITEGSIDSKTGPFGSFCPASTVTFCSLFNDTSKLIWYINYIFIIILYFYYYNII